MDELEAAVQLPMDFQVDMSNDIEAKPLRYGVGSKISSFCLPGSGTGTVSKICDKVSQDGYPIYEIVDENGETHEICETLFDDVTVIERLPQEESTKSAIVSQEDNSYIKNIREENNSEMERIITSLDLKVSEDPFNQLKNCCRLQAYMAEQNNYNGSVMDEKKDYPDEFITDIDLHNALIKKSCVCTSNSLMFQSILSRLGIPVECVGLTVNSETGGFHMANIVFLNGEWYYFDTTLEGTIRRDNSDKDLVLCCAGLGSEEYCRYYTPQCIVRKNETCQLPGNISTENIPFPVVNSFLSEEAYDEKSI